jgi:hypothetical protein
VAGLGCGDCREAPPRLPQRPVDGMVRHRLTLKSNEKSASCSADAPLSKLDRLEIP